jgi:6-phosphogluconolactonase
MKQICGRISSAIFAASVLVTVVAYSAGQSVHKGEYIAYVGTYTRQQSKGIYAFRFDPATGRSASLGLAAETDNPSFLAVHPNRRFLYAVNEIANFAGRKTGSISAYELDPQTARLKLIERVSSRGDSPCHLAVDRNGRSLFVANYGAGSVASFPILKDGRLGEAAGLVEHSGSSIHPQRQQGPHAHEVVLSPDGRFALVPDLGLDKVFVYRLDGAKSALTPGAAATAKMEPGSGPRHLAFHPDGRFAYVVNELRSTVTVFAYDPKSGILTVLQTTPTLPKDFAGSSTCAEIAAHPNGRFLYASNRGHDSIAVFAIDRRKGTITVVEHVSTQGRTPRHFAIDPTGAYLFAANQGTNSVVLFRIDRQTGHLTPTGEILEVPSPVCVAFLEARIR